MTNKPDEQRRFWATWLPWRTLYFVVYVAFSVYVLVRFWRPPINWTWWAMLVAMAYTWILFATRIAREVRSLRRPSERIDF
jgi:amino acid transporter